LTDSTLGIGCCWGRIVIGKRCILEEHTRSALSEGVSGEVEAGVRCFSFHEVEFRALSERLDIPDDFAVWANNSSKDCTVRH
jgi:hypothetical protein